MNEYIYLYEFRGIEATFNVIADSLEEADERVAAMRTAVFEGVLVETIQITDEEMKRLSGKVIH